MGNKLSHREIPIAAALAAATVAWWATFIGAGLELTDEGIANLAGERILRGQQPFADFFLFYFPGYGLLLAGAFSILGSSVLSARLAWGAIAVLRTVLAYRVARRLAPEGPAVGAALIAMMLPGPSWKVLVAALFLAGLLAALRYGEQPGFRRAVVAGLVAGVLAWFRWDAAVVTGLAWGVLWFFGPRFRRAESSSGRGLEVAAFLAGALLVVAPGLVWLWQTPGALEGVLEHFRYHRGSVAAFSIPWPSPFPGGINPPADLAESVRRLLYTLPLLGLVALPLHRFGPTGERAKGLAVWGVALATFLLAARRPDPSHFVQALPVALLPFLVLRYGPRGRWILAGVALLGALGLVSELTSNAGARRPNPTLAFRSLARIDLDRASGIRTTRGETQEIEQLVAAIRRRTGPEDRVAAIPGAAMVLFLADRQPALRYDAVYPVLLDDANRAAETVRDLEGAKLIVLGGIQHGYAGPDSPGLAEYAPELWSAIQSGFRPVGRIGRFTLLEPRETPLP